MHGVSVPFLDLFPTQQCLHVFMFSWPTHLPVAALKFFIHVTMEMTHTKHTNLKELLIL